MFNEDFQKIILNLPNMSTDEKIDRYTRGLKPFIWKELCTKNYDDLVMVMRDAERIEAAHRRFKSNTPGGFRTTRDRNSSLRKSSDNNQSNNEPTPMEIGNVQLKKLTPAEREQCLKEGLCLRCRQKGHFARNCPKGKRN